VIDPGDERRILIVAGEASGDLHGANLIRAARDLDPGLCFFGVGGERMRQAGCEIRHSQEDLAVMGLWEVFERLAAIRRVFRSLKELLRGGDRPDLLVLIDYPGFNLRLAREAKRAGVPVLYYIAPKIWASRPGRLKTLAASVDQLAVIFPFEEEIFAGAGIQVAYVGNPLLDEERPGEASEDFLRRHGLDPARPVLGLFPGSRRGEIQHIYPSLLATAALLRRRRPGWQFLIPQAPSLKREELAAPLAQAELDAVISRDNIYDLAGACDAVLCTSGTATLQVALSGTPLAALYRASRLTYEVARRIVRIPYFSLPNIVAGRGIIREFLQDQASPENLAAEAVRLIEEASDRERQLQDLQDLRQLLGEPGCSRRVAALVSAMCRKSVAKETNP